MVMLREMLFGPKWKHKNPVVRKKAIQAMNPWKAETQKIYSEIIFTDTDESIRRLIVKRILDFELLIKLQAREMDEKMNSEVNKRMMQLLLGSNQRPLELELRQQTLSQLDKADIYETVARQALEPAMRLFALDKVTRQSLFGDLAVKDEDNEVCQKALDKVTQLSTLQRVVKNSRRVNKKIYSVAHQRLDNILAEQEKPEKLLKQVRLICAELDSIVGTCKRNNEWVHSEDHVFRLQSSWQQIQQQWQELSQQSWDKALDERYQKGLSEFERHLEEQKNQQLEVLRREEQSAPIKAEQRKICDLAESQFQNFQSNDMPDREQSAALSKAIQDIANQWSAVQLKAKDYDAENGTQSMSDEFIQKYRAVYRGMLLLEKDMKSYLGEIAKIGKLQQQIGRRAKQKSALTEKDISSLAASWNSVHIPLRFKLDANIKAEIDQALSKLQQKHKKQQQKNSENIDAFSKLLPDLMACVEAGKTKRAVSLVNQAKKLLANIFEESKRELKNRGMINDFQSCVSQVSHLQEWRQWSNAPVKEELCDKMEQLFEEIQTASSDQYFDYGDVAHRIKQAREQWKGLTKSEQSSDKELWERFDKACSQAYEPCKKYFNNEAQQREQNLKQRENVCQGLEDYLEVLKNKDLEQIDWKAADKILSAAQREWRNFGYIKRSHKEKINNRYHTVMKQLRALRNVEKERNSEAKTMLIKRIDGVYQSLQEQRYSIEEAQELIKRAQVEWKTIGFAGKEKQLWEQFRQNIDKVFAEKKARIDAKNDQRQQFESDIVRLCEQVEDLARLEGVAIKNAASELESIKQQWIALELDKSHKKLEKRFRDACDDYDRQVRQWRQIEKQQLFQLQLHKRELCLKLEQALFQLLDNKEEKLVSEESVQALQQKWDALDPNKDSLSVAIQNRFQSTLDYISQIEQSSLDDVKSNLDAKCEQAIADKSLLCIKLELLADIESPNEAKQARMNYQVSQLADKMKQGVEEDVATELQQLDVQWHDSDIVYSVANNLLEQRYIHANNVIYEQFL